MNRRIVLGAGVVAAAAVTGWIALPGGKQALTIAAATDALARLRGAKINHRGGWNPAQVFAHLAQSIEYSMTGFPQPKSALFQSTVGAAALAVFHSKGAMTHSLTEPIPGAPAIAVTDDQTAALERVLAAEGAAAADALEEVGGAAELRAGLAGGAAGRDVVRGLAGRDHRERRGGGVALRAIAGRRVVGVLCLGGPVHHGHPEPAHAGFVAALAVVADAGVLHRRAGEQLLATGLQGDDLAQVHEGAGGTHVRMFSGTVGAHAQPIALPVILRVGMRARLHPQPQAGDAEIGRATVSNDAIRQPDAAPDWDGGRQSTVGRETVCHYAGDRISLTACGQPGAGPWLRDHATGFVLSFDAARDRNNTFR